MSDLQVDIDTLRQFAKTIRNSIIGGPGTGVSGLAVDTRISDAMQALAHLQFGQEVHGFKTASDLSYTYRNAYAGAQSNQKALLDALSTLATAAEKIAQSYEDAASLDAVSAKMVDAAIADSKPAATSTGQTS